MPGPDTHPRSADTGLPPDELVLAALARAATHDPRAGGAVPVWTILEHLALPRRSRSARHVQTRLGVMLAAGWVERSRRHGVRTWALTAPGAGHLRRARRDGSLELPESPQHRMWRNAHTAAALELTRFRSELAALLLESEEKLGADVPPHSDAWFELADALRQACRRVGSASHCLYEWAEPSDARADVDEHVEPTDATCGEHTLARRRARRAGRRNIRLWRERSPDS